MITAQPNIQQAEERWWSRLNDVRLRLDFARNYVEEIERIPSRDAPLQAELREAQTAKHTARQEYYRVLELYRDLIVRGRIPRDVAG